MVDQKRGWVAWFVVAPFPRRDRGPGRQAGDQTDADYTPLEERLRRLQWPSAPEGARERCLEAILDRVSPAQAAREKPETPG